MPYTPQTWINGDTTKPISAARLGVIEAGIQAARALAETVVDATATVKGLVQLSGDLGGTAAAPTVPGLAGKVGTADVRLTDARTPIDGSVTVAKIGATGTPGPTTFYRGDGTWAALTGGGAVADATATAKGVVQLAGDLGGTAALPTVPGLAGKASTTDPRFTDARTPTAHAGSHASSGIDPVTASSIGAVPTAGGATITGIKTFSTSPVVPTPTTATQAATKGYADSLLAGLDAEPIWIPAKMLDAVQGTWSNPIAGSSATIVRALADTFTGKLSAVLRLPTAWTSADFAVYWTVSTAVAGNVYMQAVTNQYVAGDVLGAGAPPAAVAPAAPGVVGQIVRTSLGTIGLSTKPIKQFGLLSIRGDATDTYTGDLQVIAFEITKLA